MARESGKCKYFAPTPTLLETPHEDADEDYGEVVRCMPRPLHGFHPDTAVHGPQPLFGKEERCFLCGAAATEEFYSAPLCATCFEKVSRG